MEPIRLEVRKRSLFLDRRDYIFITEDGIEIEKTTTEGVVARIERHVNRRMRGVARVHGRAQLLQALRQLNSPKEGYTQLVVVEPHHVEKLELLEGRRHKFALDEAIVKAIQARRPVDLLAMEKWAKDHGWYIGLSGKNQVLGGKVRLTRERLRTDFEPEKLVARSLLDKPESFRGEAILLLVLDDPFVNQATGDGAFLLKASAPRHVSRIVPQRIRRALDYEVHDALRGQTYYETEFVRKVARYDTTILSVEEDGDLVHLQKLESARIDTGAKLVHELGFKGTAMVVEHLPETIERQWPQIHGVVNASCIKSNALLAAHGQSCLWGDFQPGWILRLPVRLLFTGHERMSTRGNRISTNVLSTLHSVSPVVMDKMIEARVDDRPGSVVSALLWWADHIEGPWSPPHDGNGLSALPVRSKRQLQVEWGDHFERRFAFGDTLDDHPLFNPTWNPKGHVFRGNQGNFLVVPSARVLLATLGRIEVDGEPGFHFPDYLNTLLQTIRCLDIQPKRFEKVRQQLKDNVLAAANRMIRGHSIRVPGLHGVLIAVKGLGDQVIVPNRCGHFTGTIHGEPTMNRDGIREATVLPLGMAQERGSEHLVVHYLLENLVAEDFEAVLADFDRLTRMNRDNDGDLIYLSRVHVPGRQLRTMDRVTDGVQRFVEPEDRFQALTRGFAKLASEHDPFDLEPEVVQRAVLETAASARDVGSISWWKYVVQEALVHAEHWDLLATIAKLSQAYIDGLKGAHQTSANLFAALMRCWSRMALPCHTVKDEAGNVIAAKLSPTLHRELVRARYVPGKDFHAEVEIPHPSLSEEAYRMIKRPIVGILEDVLEGLETQHLATRVEMKAIRDVLESEYGIYPSMEVTDHDGLVQKRRQTYGSVQRLYGIRGVRSSEDLAAMEIRPLWARLHRLSTESEEGQLDRLAEQALKHCPSAEHAVVL